MSTPASTERLDLTDFEFDIPCESHTHARRNHTGPAEWIVTLRTPCTCPPRTLLVCAQCLGAGLNSTQPHRFRHRVCGQVFTASIAQTVARTERIR